MNLNVFKKEFDPLLNKFLQEKITKYSNDKDLIFLKNQFEYLQVFIKDGKRIRPYIAYITYSSFGGQDKKIINLLIFLEIFHYFCLIHDDIMDKSIKRHGIDTINYKFGNSEATLMGDYLFSWSWEFILNSKQNHIQTEKLTKVFNEMIEDVFLGQALDVHSANKKSVTNNLILKKTLHKTAGYTFIKPMKIGLLLTDKYTIKNKEFCKDLGKNLGLAFQIQDDLLDITSDFNGKKTPLSDVSEGTHTVFSNFVFENGSEKQKEILKASFGKKDLDIGKVRKVFYESGAIEYGDKIIKEYLKKAKKQAGDYRYFINLIELISHRKS